MLSNVQEFCFVVLCQHNTYVVHKIIFVTFFLLFHIHLQKKDPRETFNFYSDVIFYHKKACLTDRVGFGDTKTVHDIM